MSRLPILLDQQHFRVHVLYYRPNRHMPHECAIENTIGKTQMLIL